MTPIELINRYSHTEAYKAFYKCCSSRAWATMVASGIPFKNEEELFLLAKKTWLKATADDVLEAISHHPRIGGNMQALRDKWASQEQKGVEGATEEVLQALSKGNADYEKKFGFVFLICATGKTAKEMLGALLLRLPNTRELELENAKIEQAKITEIRLKKLIEEMK